MKKAKPPRLALGGFRQWRSTPRSERCNFHRSLFFKDRKPKFGFSRGPFSFHEFRLIIDAPLRIANGAPAIGITGLNATKLSRLAAVSSAVGAHRSRDQRLHRT